MSLQPNEFMSKMVSRIDFNADDRTVLQTNAVWGLEIAPEMADYFYQYLGRDAEMSAILNESEGRIHRLRETFVAWFHEMFTGMDDWGEAYAERRWRIGLIHVRIGIGPQHVVPAMAVVVHEAGKRAIADGKDQQLRDALAKICMVDLAFIEQAYIEVSSAAVLRETGWSEGLFRRLVATGAGAM
ncbi:protoglobin domain-containing protein [Leptolyngbya sp. CCNP1308]|uniref:protoglobin domain-containing protein n=1 Tax=Leptolyngbya sp. CCNP1308 TaxID=3110255 RepID=UPI002B21252B|nr:protoglobin domain-containing protein [Leptolyngbya sp. CCNP1308]MEA5450036.1 protoglobin domain-containing protein [Leptolyngbya sp. CCNP1308]